MACFLPERDSIRPGTSALNTMRTGKGDTQGDHRQGQDHLHTRASKSATVHLPGAANALLRPPGDAGHVREPTAALGPGTSERRYAFRGRAAHPHHRHSPPPWVSSCIRCTSHGKDCAVAPWSQGQARTRALRAMMGDAMRMSRAWLYQTLDLWGHCVPCFCSRADLLIRLLSSRGDLIQ